MHMNTGMNSDLLWIKRWVSFKRMFRRLILIEHVSCFSSIVLGNVPVVKLSRNPLHIQWPVTSCTRSSRDLMPRLSFTSFPKKMYRYGLPVVFFCHIWYCFVSMTAFNSSKSSVWNNLNALLYAFDARVVLLSTSFKSTSLVLFSSSVVMKLSLPLADALGVFL